MFIVTARLHLSYTEIRFCANLLGDLREVVNLFVLILNWYCWILLHCLRFTIQFHILS